MDLEIELFRAGTPASKGITAQDLQDVVTGFDGERNPGPVVMGHPADDQSAPAFGAVTELRADGNALFGKIKNLAQEAVDGVKSHRILNRSAAFWHPNHPSNPNPGKLSFRHLGLLGGSMPAIPSMAPLKFSADGDQETVTADGEPGAAVIFSTPGQPADADQVDLDALAEKVAARLAPEPKEQPGKEFAVATEAELKEREDALAEREKKIADQEAKFAADEKARVEQERKDREAENAQFAADLVEAGKFPAGRKDDLVSILNALPTETLQFSDDKTMAPAAALKGMLDGATPAIKFGKETPEGDAPNFSADDDGAEAQALAAAQEREANAWKAK